ncbi:MAG: 3-hydroxyacyl-CoA dehydrogenase [Carnobacterium sp.]
MSFTQNIDSPRKLNCEIDLVIIKPLYENLGGICTMDFKNITVAGGGILGSQIIFQAAFSGFEVSLYDINDTALEAADQRFKSYMEIYKDEVGATQDQVDAAYDRITGFTDLAEAVKNADLVIEAVPESIPVKEKFYRELSKVSPEKTIFATNSSTIPPSQLVGFIDRPEKFTTLHFCTEVWKHNIGEVMMHSGTKREVFDQVVEFAKAMGLVPIPIEKEFPGYVLNALFVPLCVQALRLYVNDISTPELVDKTYMICTEGPFGPFGLMDMIGINTCYSIATMMGEQGDDDMARVAVILKEQFVDKGKVGKQVGEGFYTYPNPAFSKPEFFK